MADWNEPSLASLKVDVLDEFKARDVDSVTLAESPTNPPTGYKRWVSASSKFQVWNGTTWVDMVLSVDSGGTGAANASGARTNLGLGTLATQNSNAISVSGGSIAGLTSLGVSGNGVFGGLLIAGSTPVTITDTAGKLLESAIDNAANIAHKNTNDTISGLWKFTNVDGFSIESNAPGVILRELNGSTNSKNWRQVVDGDNYYIQTLDDAVSNPANILSFSRAANVPNGITCYVPVVGNIHFQSQRFLCLGNEPTIDWVESDAITDNKYWRAKANGGIWTLGLIDDGGVAGDVGIQVNRNLTDVTNVKLNTSGQTIELTDSGNYIYIKTPEIRPDTDAVTQLGNSGKRFSTLYAQNGTINTSDIRHKFNHGNIEDALRIVNNVNPFVASWRHDHDNHKFPAFSAQEVLAELDKELGTKVVVVDREDCYQMYQERMLPVLWQAVKDLHAIVQSRG